MNNWLEPYEGNEKYIFVSYCHRNQDIVYSIIEHLVQQGYRVWFDKGIHPGDEWPETIAEHLAACHVFLMFMSSDYILSQNCTREMHYAVSKKKNFLTINLEEVQLSPGMEMQLSVSQSLNWFAYKKTEQFYAQIEKADILKECRVVEVENEAAADTTIQTEATETVTVNNIEKPLKEKKTKAAKEKKKPDKKQQKKNLIIAAVVLAVIVVAIIIAIPTKYTFGDKKYTKKDHYIYITDTPFLTEDMETLAKFEEVRTLELKNCPVDQSALDCIGELKGLTSVSFVDCTGISDYSALQNTSVRNISIINSNFNMDAFDEGWNGPSLNSVVIENGKGSGSIDWIAQNSDIKSVELTNCNITDVNKLMNLTNLTQLRLSGCEMDSITEQCKALRITLLDLSGSQLKDLKMFSDLTILKKVYLADMGMTCDADGLQCIEKSAIDLNELDLSGNKLSRATLESILGKTTALSELKLSGNNVDGDMAFLGLNSSIRKMWVNDCNITSLKGLRNENLINYLEIRNNKLRGLDGFTGFDTRVMLNIDACGNSIESIDEFMGGEYSNLLLYDNPSIKITADMMADMDIFRLGVDYGFEPEDICNASYCYINGVPADKQVEFEKSNNSFFEFGKIDITGKKLE